MLSLPAHTTHKIQPIDRSFFNSQQNVSVACSTWIRNHPGSIIKQPNIAKMFVWTNEFIALISADFGLLIVLKSNTKNVTLDERANLNESA